MHFTRDHIKVLLTSETGRAMVFDDFDHTLLNLRIVQYFGSESLLIDKLNEGLLRSILSYIMVLEFVVEELVNQLG